MIEVSRISRLGAFGLYSDFDPAPRIAYACRMAADVTPCGQSDERFERLFQALPVPVLVISPDAPRFTVIDVNDAYLAATMQTRADVVGRGIFEAYVHGSSDPPVAGVDRLRASLERVLVTRRTDTITDFRHNMAHPDGSFEERCWSLINAPVLGIDGAVEAIVHSANDVTEQHRVEVALRESEARQTFLLEVSDTLRPLAGAAEVQAATIRLLGMHLGVDRAMYVEVEGEPGRETGVIRAQHLRTGRGGAPAAAPFPERFTFAPFGPHTMAARYRGEPLVVANIHADRRFQASERAAWTAVGVRAAIITPLAKGGRLVAEFGVQCATPRAWTDAEVSLVQEVGERTWAAAQRARAEATLRESETMRRVALSGGHMGSWRWDRGADLIRGDPQFRALWGLPPNDEPQPLAIFAARMSAVGVSEMADVVTRALAAGEEFAGDLEVVSGPTAGRWVHWRGRAAPDDPAVLYGVSFDITAQKESEALLRESEARFQALFAASPVPFMVLAANPPDFTITAANQAYYAIALTTPEMLIGRRLFDIFTDDPDRPGQLGPEALDASLQRVLSTRQADTMERVRFDTVAPDGGFEPNWWRAVNAPLLDTAGDVAAIIHQVERRTEQHHAEAAERETQERLKLLVAELQHRTRNLLAVVSGIADQTLQTSDTLDEFGARFDRRLAALGRVQGWLSTGPLPSIGLFELIAMELDAHGIDPASDPAIDVAGPDVGLSPATVQLLALALHELTTNALKHGAMAVGGRLRVAWTVLQGGDGGHRLALDWQESGVPITGEVRHGFGRELIEVSLPFELDADTRLEFGADGVRCRIELDLPDASEDGSV